LRDVATVFGFKPAQIERLTHSLRHWRGESIETSQATDWGVDVTHRYLKPVLQWAGSLIGFPRHLSQHVGGFVIARHSLAEWVPVENAAMAERTVIQWDKDDLDALGLLKVDVLGLGILSAIRKALDLISQYERRPQPMRMQDIPAEDLETYAMIQKADTVGVFQIESRAQMSMLPRLKPQCFYDLVIEVALVRPGPIQGGMVHPYLKRRQGLEAIEYPSPAVKTVLERTLGVPIFQEQVMQLAMVAAGFSGGEADQLRRSMAAWKKKGGMDQWRSRWFEGLLDRGYSEAFAQASFRQIIGFGEYGFPESHSASFALLVYVSAWLKCHYPAAFTVALLNSQPMGFYAPAQLIADAQQHGVEVRPVDINASAAEATVEGTLATIRLGLKQILGLSTATIARVVRAREDSVFQDVADLVHRAHLTRVEVLQFAKAGALQALQGNRYHSAWAALGVESVGSLWPIPHLEQAGLPLLTAPTEGQDVVADYRSLGLSLRRHPVAIIRERVVHPSLLTNALMKSQAHGQWVGVIGLVLVRQRPPTAKGVMFITLEDESGSANLVVWPHRLQYFEKSIVAAQLLEVFGRVQRSGEVVHLVVERVVDRSAWLGAVLEAAG
jgi:error-prone DNA polymerase